MIVIFYLNFICDIFYFLEDEMMEAIRFNKSNMYKGEDPSKVMMNLSKAKRKYDEDSEPEDNKVIETK